MNRLLAFLSICMTSVATVAGLGAVYYTQFDGYTASGMFVIAVISFFGAIGAGEEA